MCKKKYECPNSESHYCNENIQIMKMNTTKLWDSKYGNAHQHVLINLRCVCVSESCLSKLDKCKNVKTFLLKYTLYLICDHFYFIQNFCFIQYKLVQRWKKTKYIWVDRCIQQFPKVFVLHESTFFY